MTRYTNMTKRGLCILLTLAVLSLYALSLTSCASEQKAQTVVEKVPTAAIAIVIGQTANARHIAASDPIIRIILEPVNQGGGYMSLFVAASEPVPLGSPIKVPPPKNAKADALTGRLEDSAGFFKSVYLIDDTIPATGEVDYLEAIRLAVASLNTPEALACDDRTLYVIGSGLSTSGDYINFADGIIAVKDPKTFVEDIIGGTTAKGANQSEALPNLDGINVVWYGMGQLTAEPQMDVPPSAIARMKEIWTQVLVQSGALGFDINNGFRDYISSTAANRVDDGFPMVTTVFFEPAETEDYLIKSSITFNENVVSFIGESDEYVDAAKATAALQPFAEALVKSEQTIVVLGTTASGDPTSCRDLGYRRATRFGSDLIALGVNPSQIIIVSAGNEGIDVQVNNERVDFYHEDRDSYGIQIDEIAHMNRAVHIIPLEQARDVLVRFG